MTMQPNRLHPLLNIFAYNCFDKNSWQFHYQNKKLIFRTLQTLMTTIQSIVITQDLNKKQLKSFKHNDTSDDFLRLASSLTGKYLASISLKRQLTLYNLENGVLVQNFTEQNITHIAFSQRQNLFAVTTKIPNLKLYEIYETSSGLTTVTLMKQIQQTTQNANSYGWLAWPLDNKYLFYVKDEEIFYLDTANYSYSVIRSDVTIKSTCSPYYVIYDRVYNQLISCSKTGRICKFKVQSNTDVQGSNQVALDFLESTNIGSNYMIADIGQSKELIFVNTVKITTSGNTFYNSYSISKRSLNSFSVISLRSELIAPGLMIQTDNFHSYILCFIKGEQNLYIYNSLQVLNPTSSADSLNSSNLLSLKQIQKVKMPFLLHSVHYNEPSDRLIFGVTGQKNQDKLVFMDFKFDCARIANISDSTMKQSQLKKLCMDQCKKLSIDNYFSFSEAKCIKQPVNTVIQMQGCFYKSKSHEWNQRISTCELKCHKIQHSFSQIAYGIPEKCVCNEGHLWYSNSSQCLTAKQIQQSQKTSIENKTSGIDNNAPLFPAKDNKANQSSIDSQQSGGSSAVIVSVLLVILVVVVVFITVAYKYKKWCFRKDSYVQQNELKQSDIKQNQNKSQSNHQKDENQVRNDQIGLQREKSIAKKDQFKKQNELIDDIISQNYYEEQIKTDSNQNDEDYQVDSERKL